MKAKAYNSLDFPIIILNLISFVTLLGAISYSSPKFIFISLIILSISTFLLSYISETIKKYKADIFNLSTILIIIIHGLGIAIMAIFLYNFLLFDYTYFSLNELILNKLFLFSLIFLTFEFAVILIRALKYLQKTPYCIFNLLVSILLFTLTITMLYKLTFQINSINKSYVLPNIQTSQSALLGRQEMQNINRRFNDIKSLQRTNLNAEITKEETLSNIAKILSNKPAENLTTLKKLKLYSEKEKSGFYELYFIYNNKNQTNDKGYISSIEIIDTDIIVLHGRTQLHNLVVQEGASTEILNKNISDDFIVNISKDEIKSLLKLVTY